MFLTEDKLHHFQVIKKQIISKINWLRVVPEGCLITDFNYIDNKKAIEVEYIKPDNSFHYTSFAANKINF